MFGLTLNQFMSANELTVKQEKFCQEYVTNGGNASEAYRRSYDVGECKPETIWVNASQLLADTKVSQRVAELQKDTNKKYEITRDYLTGKMMKVIEAGEQDNKDLLRKAIMDLAKMHGLIEDKLVHRIDDSEILERIKNAE